MSIKVSNECYLGRAKLDSFSTPSAEGYIATCQAKVMSSN